MSVGDNIRRIRKEKGLTQAALANALNVSQQMIGQFENGKNPKLETIEKIATALGVTAFDLMGIEYFDLKYPNAGKQYAEYSSFQSYLSSLGYIIKEKPERYDAEGLISCSYVVSGNGVSVVLSNEEYNQLQSSAGDLIFSFLWKKQHKK
ncbi:helix-turn-helix domain-containing protein [Intestinimonas sp. MSJ-38]|uniref:helix-turn-helix domain-containing protein n=1 Tax=Intestinimonas sp. MSJ-38 TaxID=2841532 RepID=UPI001C0F88E5|nr:helix-turn-helix transcriptional regulator [Intestinimonas sp. MSJ-38]MBU5432629.1 helix-turn-helix domain-containing protein [Intestinimonas sp. MSJ-38]